MLKMTRLPNMSTLRKNNGNRDIVGFAIGRDTDKLLNRKIDKTKISMRYLGFLRFC